MVISSGDMRMVVELVGESVEAGREEALVSYVMLLLETMIVLVICINEMEELG